MLKKTSPSPRILECEPMENGGRLTERSPVGTRRNRPEPPPPDWGSKVKEEVTPPIKDEPPKETQEQNPDKKTIVPLIRGEQDCVKLVEEGDCSPRSWSVDDVKVFLEINDMPEPARKLKVSGESLLKLNKEAVAVKVALKTTLALMKLIAMLRRIEQAYVQKRCPPSPPPTPSPSMFLSDYKIPKRKFSEPEITPQPEREPKRLKFAEYQSPSARGVGVKICYKCNGQGHLGRECMNAGGDQTAPKNTTAPVPSLDDDWDTVPVGAPTPAVTVPAVVQPSKGQDDDNGDWGSAPDSIVTPGSTPTSVSSYRNNRGGGRGRGGFDRGGGRGGGGHGSGPRTCFRCNKEGHISRDCAEAPSGGRGGGKKICYKCSGEGHLGRDCTNSGGGHGSGNSSQVATNSSSTAVSTDEDWGTPATLPAAQTVSQIPSPPVLDDDWGSSSSTVSTVPSRNGNNYSGNAGGGRGSFERSTRGGGGGQGAPRTCFRCNQEGHISRDCPQGAGSGGANRGGGRGSGGRMVCFKCSEEGHMSRECTKNGSRDAPASSSTSTAKDDDWTVPTPLPPTSETQAPPAADDDWGSSSTISTPAPSWNNNNGNRGDGRGGFSRGGGRGGPRNCFRCNEEGHMSRDCPRNAERGGGGNRGGGSGSSGPRKCYNCQEEGHMSWACPKGSRNDSN